MKETVGYQGYQGKMDIPLKVTPQQDVERPSIHTAVNRLFNLLGDANEAAELLRDRLSPILVPEAEASIAGNKVGVQNNGSIVQAQLDTMAERMETLIYVLRNIYGRVDV